MIGSSTASTISMTTRPMVTISSGSRMVAADIARQLRFPEAVSRGIHALDEHWSGQGQPEGLAGSSIPLYARIALLAQVVDVFRTADGPAADVLQAAFPDREIVQVPCRPLIWQNGSLHCLTMQLPEGLLQ